MTRAQRAILQDAADDAARAGRVFAVQLQQFADDYGVDAPALSAALAIVFAGLIVDLDACPPTLYEALGFGRATDAARIDLFADHVRAALAALRADRDGLVH